MQEIDNQQPGFFDRIAVRLVNLGEKARIGLLVLALFGLLGGAYFLTYMVLSDETDLSHLAREIDAIVISGIAAQNYLNPPEIRKNYVPKRDGNFIWEQIEVAVTLDESQSTTGLGDALKKGLNLPNLTIDEGKRNDDTGLGKVQLSVRFGNLPIYQVLIMQKKPVAVASIPRADIVVEQEPSVQEIQKDVTVVGGRSKIALVVDDVGYDIKNAIELLELRYPLTVSIFPHLKHSKHIAQLAHDMGYEVMLHLPMESGKRLRRNPGFISPHMNEKELCWVLDRDIMSVPHVIGINNHQGSLMTRDAEAMTRVMRYLAEKDYFFIDSRTTSESVAYDVAKEHGLRAAKNNLFLDNIKEVEYIKGQIAELMQDAREKGNAIGICHVHSATIKALREMLPVMEENGIELVFVSELVN